MYAGKLELWSLKTGRKWRVCTQESDRKWRVMKHGYMLSWWCHKKGTTHGIWSHSSGVVKHTQFIESTHFYEVEPPGFATFYQHFSFLHQICSDYNNCEKTQWNKSNSTCSRMYAWKYDEVMIKWFVITKLRHENKNTCMKSLRSIHNTWRIFSNKYWQWCLCTCIQGCCTK